MLTRGTDGSVQYWFTPGITQRNGLREHYVRIGSRVIARVSQQPIDDGGGSGVVITGDRAARSLAWSLWTLCAVLFGFALFGPMPRRLVMANRRRHRVASAMAALAMASMVTAGCGVFSRNTQLTWQHDSTLYFHQGVSAGPTLLTREDGTVFEERRYSPFGEDLDAFSELPGGGTQLGEVDFSAEPQNILNKQTDPDTGWSYHGARWMAPETARWLTPDPPVKAPDPKFLTAPWELSLVRRCYDVRRPLVFNSDQEGVGRGHSARPTSASLGFRACKLRWRSRRLGRLTL